MRCPSEKPSSHVSEGIDSRLYQIVWMEIEVWFQISHLSAVYLVGSTAIILQYSLTDHTSCAPVP